MPWWGWVGMACSAIAGLALIGWVIITADSVPTLTPDEIARLIAPDEPI